MISILSSTLARISFKWAINFSISSYSPLNFSCSSPVNWPKRMATIALACLSVKLKRSISAVCASTGVLEARINLMTSSIWSEAIINPSRICALSSAFRSSNWVRRITTSCRWSTKWWIRSLRFSNLGRPCTKATLFTPKEDCKAVCFSNVFKTTLDMASFFTSITIRIPSRSDSSLILEIPSIFFSLIKSAIRDISSALLTM